MKRSTGYGGAKWIASHRKWLGTKWQRKCEEKRGKKIWKRFHLVFIESKRVVYASCARRSSFKCLWAEFEFSKTRGDVRFRSTPIFKSNRMMNEFSLSFLAFNAIASLKCTNYERTRERAKFSFPIFIFSLQKFPLLSLNFSSHATPILTPYS